MRVTEAMRNNPVCCVPGTNAMKAAALMRQFNTGVLVVVEDLDLRKVVGIVTDRDLCIRVLASAGDPEHTMVQDCMTRDPFSCTAQQEMAQVLTLMATHKIRRVPVVDEANRILGIITDSELLENPDIDPHSLCVALGRITESRTKARGLDSGTSYP